MSGSWLMRWQALAPTPTVLCLAQAGAGCGQFRRWQALAGPSVSIIGVQLPGRENRWHEPAARTIDEVIAEVLAELPGHVTPGLPLVIYGHSFGGLLAYEITRRLGEQVRRWPEALVVAACRPPHHWDGAGRGLLDSDDELGRLLDLRGLDSDELDEDSRQVQLEILRGDARMSLSYRHHGRVRLACPLHAWGGDLDDTVSAHQLEGWADYTSGHFSLAEFPGGHHFVQEQAASLVGRLCALARHSDLPSRP
jgi:surfactin synthase thioesterase subunit